MKPPKLLLSVGIVRSYSDAVSNHTEFLPQNSLVEEFVDSTINSQLERIAQETKTNLRLQMHVMIGERAVHNFRNVEIAGDHSATVSGVVRLRFCEAVKGTTLMHAEAVFEESECVDHCSGFWLKAQNKDSVISTMGFEIRFSVWDWVGWN
jgi:hypothetical protein